MSDFSEEMRKHYEDEEAWYELQKAKVGPYDNPEKGCPNCGRFRVMIGDDKKHRCEKCCWCIEDNQVDYEFAKYDF